MRLTAAMFDAAELSAKACVGDPALASAGAGEQRSRIKAIVVLAWRALNLDLSFRKGQAGCVISWIGALPRTAYWRSCRATQSASSKRS
eukprot:5602540-Pyramimonas_sp.AAC.1